jgi:hypothetical protein
VLIRQRLQAGSRGGVYLIGTPLFCCSMIDFSHTAGV